MPRRYAILFVALTSFASAFPVPAAQADTARCRTAGVGATGALAHLEGEATWGLGYDLTLSNWAPSPDCSLWGLDLRFVYFPGEAEAFLLHLGARHSWFLGETPEPGESKNVIYSPHLYAQVSGLVLGASPDMTSGGAELGYGVAAEIGLDAAAIAVFASASVAQDPLGDGLTFLPMVGVRLPILEAIMYSIAAGVGSAAESEE